MLNTYLSIPKQPHLHFQKTLDIWQVNLKDHPHPDEIDLLSEDEHLRANRFYFERHRRRFTTARIRLRQILATYLDANPAKLEFHYTSYGKPYLKNCELQFNLSHSKDIALLAINLTYSVGIDIEFYSTRPFLGLGRNLFSEQENEVLKKIPDALKPLCFFHLWAQKEAVIKAVGIGLSYPTATIQLPCLPSTYQHAIQTLDGQSWKVDGFSPILGARAAVCYHPSISTIRYSHEA